MSKDKLNKGAFQKIESENLTNEKFNRLPRDEDAEQKGVSFVEQFTRR